MNGTFWKSLFLFSLLCSVHVAGRRGGGGGFGRSGGFGSRGSSAARASSSKSGGGWFGGGGSKSTSGTGMGTHHGGGISQPNYGRSGSGTGTGGGIFGSKTGSGGGGYRTSTFSGSGIGSRSRSDTFKNMIVGAAAGYLTYQAGKAIIRSMAAPMTWGERNYYWGQQYYPGGGYSSGKTMCRMPLDNDPRFGDIYTPEGSRPKEIVWSCSYNEQCCGYECCPGYGGGYQPGYSGWNSGRGIGLGTIVLLLLICCCGAFILKKFFDQKRQNNEQTFVHNNKEGYQPGHASYTASTAPDGPSPYPAATSSGGYPPENGFRYPPA